MRRAEPYRSGHATASHCTVHGARCAALREIRWYRVTLAPSTANDFQPLQSFIHRLLTHPLLWLVVLALPLQGFTAAVMMTRGGAMDDARTTLTTPDDGVAMSDGCHEYRDIVAADAEPKTPAQSRCKTRPICAVCPLGSVVPLAASLGMPLVRPSGAVLHGLAVSFCSFIPEAPQRPPLIYV